MSMDKVRAEIELAIRRAEDERTILETRIAAYRDVLGTIEDIAAQEPETPAAVVVDTAPRSPTGRAPRRDLQGAIRQAVRDFIEARGVGPTLAEAQEGAAILVGSPVVDSAARRVLTDLVSKGDLFLTNERYHPAGFPVSHGRPVAVAE